MNTRLVSKHLQRLRKQHHYTQEDLAQELNISRQAISKWETGNTIPDLETLLKLSKLYHISINNILEPNISPSVIEDFEQIPKISEAEIKHIFQNFPINDIAKALMGASPTVNEFVANLFPNINFEKKQKEMGRVKITDIEDVQNQITAMINLEMTNKKI